VQVSRWPPWLNEREHATQRSTDKPRRPAQDRQPSLQIDLIDLDVFVEHTGAIDDLDAIFFGPTDRVAVADHGSLGDQVRCDSIDELEDFVVLG
jgi:hypothetical protein